MYNKIVTNEISHFIVIFYFYRLDSNHSHAACMRKQIQFLLYNFTQILEVNCTV